MHISDEEKIVNILKSYLVISYIMPKENGISYTKGSINARTRLSILIHRTPKKKIDFKAKCSCIFSVLDVKL